MAHSSFFRCVSRVCRRSLATPLDTPRTHRSGSGTAPPRIVVVDDQVCFRRVARVLLEAHGYDVVAEAADAGEAADAVGRHAPDGVLLDVRLGTEDGLEVSAELTSKHPGLAVLLTSADDLHEFGQAVEESGARGFVPKLELAAADLSCYWPA